MKQYYCTKCKKYFDEDDVEFTSEHVKFHWFVAPNGGDVKHQVMGQEEDAERLARESAGD